MSISRVLNCNPGCSLKLHPPLSSCFHYNNDKSMFLTNRVKLTEGKNREQCLKKSERFREILVLFYFWRFFLEQNNRIFQTLNEVAGSPDPTVTQDSVKAMGLDPHGDRLFLLHLLEIYGYDSLLVSEQLCCSWVFFLFCFFSVCHHCWFNTGGLSASDCCTTGFGTLLKAPCCNVWSTEGLLHGRQFVWTQWYRQKAW